MTTNSRELAVCTFADEKTTTPTKVGELPWDVIVGLHAKRRIRPGKSGHMLGGYAVNGTRCDANVPFRSLIQLDIDTEGVKDEKTGRISQVTRAAPPLDDIRSGIDEYEWCAASSHSHELQRGVIKYRVVILPDRDIQPEEYEPLLETLDQLLHGALDRGAWQWSQAFYLPSCPAENQGEAFFVHNHGAPLPVDEFVRRGREIIAAKTGLASNLAGSPQSQGKFPPSSALEIINHCPTLAHVAQLEGAVSEPLWRKMLGVVKYTTEGDAVCHQWSMGDPRYNKSETQLKIDRWTAGPTLCESFRKSADAKCDGCKQTCKSPIRLGWSNDIKPIDAALHEMNLRYFVAKVGANVHVFDEQGESLLANGMSFTAFKQFKAGFMIEGRNIPHVWLNSPLRRTYDSLVFEPSGKCSAASYNTWRGFAITPAEGECGLIVAHIRDVWCNGDIAQFHYVMRWMALLVQKPWIKPEVALVLRSKEGTGKNIIVTPLLKMLGVHGFITAQKEQVAGRFNGHLFDKVLVVLDEAFFAGDPAAVAAAKTLVTNSPLGYEAKGKDAFSAPNFAHVISLTNNEWAVPAGEDSRRWMVLDVGEARKGDHAYFMALAEEIGHGGTEAFLHLLLKIKLRKYNPRVLPRSDALHAQQVETLTRRDAPAAWWLHVLSEGSFPSDGHSTDWDVEVATVVLQDSYTKYTARFRGAPVWDVAAKRVRSLLPSSGLQKLRRAQGMSRSFVYALPDLNQARQDFKSVTGIDPCAT